MKIIQIEWDSTEDHICLYYIIARQTDASFLEQQFTFSESKGFEFYLIRYAPVKTAMVIKKFVLPDVQIGFSALMSAVVFMGGAIMLMLGMIGEYLGRLYISQNKNPQFVIRETTRDETR